MARPFEWGAPTWPPVPPKRSEHFGKPWRSSKFVAQSVATGSGTLP